MLALARIAELDIGGGNACAPEEYQFLGALVQLTAPAAILEIGTSTGIGALVMAAAAVEAGSDARVTTMDLPLGHATFEAGLARNRALVEGWCPGVRDRVEYVLGASHAVLDRFLADGRRFDLVFIDGGHTDVVVRGDWGRAVALGPRTIVLHDTVHLDAVARLASEITERHSAVTFTYPRRASREPGTPTGPDRPGPDGPGLTVVTSIAAVERARARSERPSLASLHETASDLVARRIVTRPQVRLAFPTLPPLPGDDAARDARPLRQVDIILAAGHAGDDDPDAGERMMAVAAVNHERLTDAGVPHTFTLVEWCPPGVRGPLLADRLAARLPWWHRTFVISPAWQTSLAEHGRRPFSAALAINAGVRRAAGDWILAMTGDVVLPDVMVGRLAAGSLSPGTLFLAMPGGEEAAHDEARGRVVLCDRDSALGIAGFDERAERPDAEGIAQLCAQAAHFGLSVEWLGSATPGRDRHEAPLYWNRPTWGLLPAVAEPSAAGPIWLRTPEEAGPALSVVLAGTEDVRAVAATVAGLLDRGASIEVHVVHVGPAVCAALDAWSSDTRLRVRPVSGPSLARAVDAALSSATGRYLLVLPGPGALGGLARLEPMLDGTDRAMVLCSGGGSPGMRVLTIVSRGVFDTLGGLDVLAPLAVDDFEQRARHLCPPRVIDGLTWTPHAGSQASGGRVDTTVETDWIGLEASAPVPATVAADFQRRSEQLASHLHDRLARQLPAEAKTVVVWGVGPLTPLAVAALRALDRDVVAIHAPDADGSQACAGVPIRPAGELDWTAGVWTVSAAATPADVIALLRQVPAARIVHLVEPACLRRSSPPLMGDPHAVALARTLRMRGEYEAAERVCHTALRGPSVLDVAPIVYELALVSILRHRQDEAERLLRWLLRRWPERRSLLHYNLGSLQQQRGRLPAARRHFALALALAPAEAAAHRAGCHYHLGVVALAVGARDEAAGHFAAAIAILPDHRGAREQLRALGGGG